MSRRYSSDHKALVLKILKAYKDDVLAASRYTGVPERTLRRQFHRFTGHSALAFHRNLRLEAAHRALNSLGSDTDVTTAATDHGFSHFGQFAARSIFMKVAATGERCRLLGVKFSILTTARKYRT